VAFGQLISGCRRGVGYFAEDFEKHLCRSTLLGLPFQPIDGPSGRDLFSDSGNDEIVDRCSIGLG